MTKSIFSSKVKKIFNLLETAGATEIFVVGGFVRDQILKIPNKDMDIEVYGLSYSEIAQALSSCFRVDLVGQCFGVLKIDNEIDISLPRKESKSGRGHKGFDVHSDPSLSLEEAFARRDFTINAIGMRRDGSFYDPFDGIGDLRRGILRATSQAFKDDPLRVLRGIQFCARFGFDMDSQTILYCRELFSEFPTLSEERIYEEWTKWALKGKWMQKSLHLLRETGWIKAFPELDALIDCPQNPCWHPEGDVFVHTSLVCEELAHILREQFFELSEEDRTVLMFAALGHDFGKAVTTHKDEQGIIRSLGHAEAGVPLIRQFLERMKAPHRIVAKVLPLVREHMSLMNLKQSERPSPKMVRRLACRLEPANIKLWTLLCQSDARGCFAPERHYQQESSPFDQSDLKWPKQPESLKTQSKDILTAKRQKITKRKIRFRADLWFELAQELEVAESQPQPLIRGRDLIQLGVRPGPEMGQMLQKIFDAQLDGLISTFEEGIQFFQNQWPNSFPT